MQDQLAAAAAHAGSTPTAMVLIMQTNYIVYGVVLYGIASSANKLSVCTAPGSGYGRAAGMNQDRPQ
jgi:hypothetical protein